MRIINWIFTPERPQIALPVYLAILTLILPLTALRAPAASLLLPQDAAATPHHPAREAMLSWIDRQRATIIAMQRDLVSLPALNPEHGGVGEEQKFRWLEARLKEYGITDLTRLDVVDDRVPGKIRQNLVARYPALEHDSPPRPTLWLITHLDVFPPGPAEEWKSDPFTLRVEGDTLYGRGVEDNHQGIVTSILLVGAVRAAGIAPTLNIGLLFCSGALTNYDMNIKHVLDAQPGIVAPGDLILVLDHGNEHGSLIEVAEKGNMWTRFTVTGQEGHAGSPEKTVNAFDVGAEMIHALRDLRTRFPARNPLFTHPYSTFSVTMSENHSNSANHIPGKFVFYLDSRLLPEYSFAEVEQALRTLADDVAQRENARIDIDVLERTPMAVPTAADAPVVRLLSRAVQDQLGVAAHPGGIGGVTMASALRERGIPVAVWGILKNWRNMAEENASISSHIDQAKVLACLYLDPEAAGSRPAPTTTENGTSDEQ